MKEVTIQDIRKIEDAELRWLTRYEHLISWGKSGTLRLAAQAYYDQIAQAEQKKALAQLRIAQIDILETAVSRFDGRAIRTAQMAAIAAKHRADAAERHAIQAACDEIMALEEIVPADDIDDILSTVSAALGIELPGHDAKADICQRGAKSMADVKRELGPSIWDQRIAAQKHDRFEKSLKTDRYAKLIQDFSKSVMSHHHAVTASADENKWVYTFDMMIDARNRLFEAITTLKDYATDLVAPKDEPPFPLHRLRCNDPFARAPWNEHLSKIELWALSHFERLTDEVWEWIAANKDKQEWREDALDDEALDVAYNVVSHPFDAGKTLEQLGWYPPSDEPPGPHDGVTPIAEIIRRAAA